LQSEIIIENKKLKQGRRGQFSQMIAKFKKTSTRGQISKR